MRCPTRRLQIIEQVSRLCNMQTSQKNGYNERAGMQHGEAPRVAIVNQVGFHNEVYSALLWSFQQSGANATAFVEMDFTWHIQDVLRDWYAAFQSLPKYVTCKQAVKHHATNATCTRLD